MIPDPKPIPYAYDYAVDFSRGIDSSKAPDLILDGYTSFAVNTTFRGGKPQTRPAFHEIALPAQEHLDNFQQKKHQGDTIYRDYGSEASFMISVRGGLVYKLDFATRLLTVLNPSDPNNTTRRHYFQQVDKFLIIQNGVDVPFIYDGITIRRARNSSNNPPRGVDNLSITNVAGVATVTTQEPHGFQVGDFVHIRGQVFPPGYSDYPYYIFEVPSDTTYKIEVSPTLGNASDAGAGKSYYPMEVPTGLFMEFCLGRLCVVLPDRKSMRIGDLIRSAPTTGSVDSVLWFTDDQYLAESYILSLPATQGRIRAIAAIPFMGTGTGQGDLMVSGETGISTLSLSLPRAEWKSNPVQKVAIQGTGVASQTGVTGYNGDILYRDIEFGIRSFRLADARFTKNPSQAPISAELNRIFAEDDQDKLEFADMEVFDNRLLTTVTPQFEERRVRINITTKAGTLFTINYNEPVTFEVGDKINVGGSSIPNGEYEVVSQGSPTSVDIISQTGSAQATPKGWIWSQKTGAEYYHKGLAVLDYTTLSGAGGETSAAWDGIWTGLNPQCILKSRIANKTRCFITHYNEKEHRNEIWEIMRTQGLDTQADGDTRYPECWIELASMDCGKPFSLKRLGGVDLFMTQLSGELTADIFYRNDGSIDWRSWSDPNKGSTVDLCASSTLNPIGETDSEVQGVTQFLPQHRIYKVPQPSQYVCNRLTSHDSRLFYETQIKIRWQGLVTWDKVKLMAFELIETARGNCS
jgi:hypothetical protein